MIYIEEAPLNEGDGDDNLYGDYDYYRVEAVAGATPEFITNAIGDISPNATYIMSIDTNMGGVLFVSDVLSGDLCPIYPRPSGRSQIFDGDGGTGAID